MVVAIFGLRFYYKFANIKFAATRQIFFLTASHPMENIPIKKAMFNSVLNDFSLLKLKANKCSILLAIVEGQMKKVMRKLKTRVQ
jgi:hypothetical protein